MDYYAILYMCICKIVLIYTLYFCHYCYYYIVIMIHIFMSILF